MIKGQTESSLHRPAPPWLRLSFHQLVWNRIYLRLDLYEGLSEVESVTQWNTSSLGPINTFYYFII